MAKFKLNNKKYESYSRTYIEWYETNDWRLNRAIQMCQNLDYFWTWKWRLNLWNTSKVVVPKRDKTDWEPKEPRFSKWFISFASFYFFSELMQICFGGIEIETTIYFQVYP